jgi:hypothetical protein
MVGAGNEAGPALLQTHINAVECDCLGAEGVRKANSHGLAADGRVDDLAEGLILEGRGIWDRCV